MRKATVMIYDCYPRTLEVGAGGSGIQSQFSDTYQVQGYPELLKTPSLVKGKEEGREDRETMVAHNQNSGVETGGLVVLCSK